MVIRTARFCVLVFPLLLMVGCVQLTEKQQEDVAEINKQIVVLEAELAKLVPLADAAIAAFEKAKADPNSTASELNTLAAEVSLKKGAIVAVKESTEILFKKNKAIHDSGVKWYQQLWLLLPGLAAGGYAAYNRHRAAKASDAERAVVSTAFGVLSRAADAASSQPVGPAVNDELAKTELSSEDMRSLHHAAIGGSM